MSSIEHKTYLPSLCPEHFIVCLYYILLYFAETWTLKEQNTNKLLSDTVRAGMDVLKNALEVTEINR